MSPALTRKIVIFGAEAITGLCTVQAALKQGQQVRAIMRGEDHSVMPEELREQVEMFTCNVFVSEDVDKAVEGRDAVVVILPTKNDLISTVMMFNGLENILFAMKKSNIKVISVCLSTFLFRPKTKVLAIIYGMFDDDRERIFSLLHASEDLNWIAVLRPYNADTPSGEYSVEIGSSLGKAISKYDSSKFMIECLSNPEYYKKKYDLAIKVHAP